MKRLTAVLLFACWLAPFGADAQVTSTRIRDGVQAGEADVLATEPGGSAQGLVTRPVTPTTAWPVNAAQSGSWTVQQGSPPWSVSQSGSWTVQQGTPPWQIRIRDASGTDLATVGADGSLKVDNSSHTQPVSGTVTANQGGAPWSIRLQDASGSTQVVVTGAGALKVDGSAVTQPVSIAGTVTTDPSDRDARVLGRVKLHDGTDVAQVTTTGGGSLQVECSAGCSGGTQYDEDTLHVSGDKLTLAGVVRNDAGTALAADGDRTVLQVDSSGALRVAGGAGGTQYDEDTASAAADKVTMAGAVRKDTAASLVDTDGDRTELQTDGSGRLRVTAADTTQPVSGTVTANAGSGTFTVSGTTFDGIIRDGTGDTTQANVSSGRLHVDVTGTVTANAGTNLNTSALALDATLTGRFPAGSNPADNETNSVNITRIGSYNFCFDGAAWDRCQGYDGVLRDGTGDTTQANVTNGRLNTDTLPGLATATLSGWTSATSVNATQTILTSTGAGAGVGSVLVHLVQTSTITGGAITFEVTYDGTNWVTIPADAVLDPASTTFAQISLPYTLVASTNKPFLLMGKGWQGLRIKLSTAITGTATVTPNYALLPYEPAKSVIALSPTAANFNVTTTPPSNASTNVAQFGGTNVSTGTGAGGAGIPRVTLSNDSSLAANQSTNVAQVNGATTQVASNGLNSTGGGLQATALAGQLDDTSANTCTENQFCHARISSKGVLYGQIRDAAGNERGANVNASNELNVSAAVTSFPDNEPFNVAQINGVAPSMGNGASGTGVQRVTIANDSTGVIQEIPGTAGGLSVHRRVATASDNAQSVKASAGQVYMITIMNEATTLRWVHLYNTSGTPTCNTSIIASFGVPGGSAGAASNITIPVGIAFGTGIGACSTTTRDGTGNTTANDTTYNIFYK